jgi:YceI-like domain
MTFRQTRFLLLFTFLILMLCESTKAQILYRQTGDSYIAISGTSTLHEWTLTTKEPKYQASFELNEQGAPVGLNSLLLTVRCESLKSGHSAMDKNTYSTLNTDTYKSITFNMVSATLINKKIQCEGDLTVAGATKRITVEVTYKVVNQSIVCSGTKKIKMSDYGIDPPSFMFGTVRTGDEMTVSFNVNLAPVQKK